MGIGARGRWRYGLSAQMGFVMPRYARLGVIRRGARLVARVLLDKTTVCVVLYSGGR